MCINSKKDIIAEVISHLVKHSNDKTIGKTKLLSNLNCCSECVFVAKNEHGLKIHKGKAHSTEKETNKLDQLDNLELKVSDEKSVYNCPTCQFKFTDQNVLDNHVHNNHKDKPTQNSISPNSIEPHNKAIVIKDESNPSHTTETVSVNECKDCNQYFTTHETLNKNIATHRKLNIGGTPGVTLLV